MQESGLRLFTLHCHTLQALQRSGACVDVRIGFYTRPVSVTCSHEEMNVHNFLFCSLRYFLSFLIFLLLYLMMALENFTYF